MKKIYYLQKYEVKLGDAIEYNGIKALVTKELIELNPELFIVEDPMQELLDKAKRDYPAGTVFRSFFGGVYTVGDKPRYSLGAHNSILIDNTYVYRDGRWVEILPLKFTTEDGVDIYGNMKTYLVGPDTISDINSRHDIWWGNTKRESYKYFYHKENALDYLEKHKEKTLEDYENMLLTINIDSINAREACWFYRTLKRKEPKLYYTKILQLIADDLNDGWVADFSDNKEKWLVKEGDSDCTMGTSGWTERHNCGAVPFKTKDIAEKARVILGDKVKYLFS